MSLWILLYGRTLFLRDEFFHWWAGSQNHPKNCGQLFYLRVCTIKGRKMFAIFVWFPERICLVQWANLFPTLLSLENSHWTREVCSKTYAKYRSIAGYISAHDCKCMYTLVGRKAVRNFWDEWIHPSCSMIRFSKRKFFHKRSRGV